MSCGDFKGVQIFKETAYKQMNMPNYFDRWINLKKVFPINEVPKNTNELNSTTFTEFSSKWTKHNQVNQIKK